MQLSTSYSCFGYMLPYLSVTLLLMLTYKVQLVLLLNLLWVSDTNVELNGDT